MIPLFWLELNMGPEVLGTGLPRGVKAVIAKSFESTHRSNLVGMGIIPLCFKDGEDAETLGLTGHERYISVSADNGKSFTCALRFDTVVRTNSTFGLRKVWLLRRKMMRKEKFIPKFH
ncbi:hypothetical protein Vadar_001140 [Vaccinium darrowii]|uniref:Uncharacterized protein n=1 Tax=Vaccinium darrowii TaxID=229202 RepID=A0ACB7Y465_9ERIC|nr:hypothetical protein Vadar_001140 [Vaccinium darrowii]